MWLERWVRHSLVPSCGLVLPSSLLNDDERPRPWARAAPNRPGTCVTSEGGGPTITPTLCGDAYFAVETFATAGFAVSWGELG